MGCACFCQALTSNIATWYVSIQLVLFTACDARQVLARNLNRYLFSWRCAYARRRAFMQQLSIFYAKVKLQNII